MKLDRILVPIDFSDTARRALTEAATLGGSAARLTLLHVHAVRQVSVMEFSYVEPPDAVRGYVEAAERHLETWARDLGVGGRADLSVVLGDPVAAIVEASRSHDLVVMGTHGRTGMEHFVLGSVAERVVRHAKCSVLIAR